MHPSERQFANFLESQDKTWVYHPKRFKFDGTSYQADFYCPEDDIYYEVKTRLTSEDAFLLLKFKKLYPKIRLKVVSPNGYPYYSYLSGRYFELIYKKLDFLKSTDVLEISFDDYDKYIYGFSYWKASPNCKGNHRTFPGSPRIIKSIREIKKKLGTK